MGVSHIFCLPGNMWEMIFFFPCFLVIYVFVLSRGKKCRSFVCVWMRVLDRYVKWHILYVVYTWILDAQHIYAIRLTSMHTVKLIANIKRTHNIRIKGDEVERGIWNSEWISENSRLYFGMSICLDRNIDLHMIVRYAEAIYTRTIYYTYMRSLKSQRTKELYKQNLFNTLLSLGYIYTSAIMNLNHCRFLNQNKGERGNSYMILRFWQSYTFKL